MSDKVQTQEEAIALAITFLKDIEVRRRQSYIEGYKDNPEKLKHVDEIFIEWKYRLWDVAVDQDGWLLTFMMFSEGAVVDPSDRTVYINRVTGDAEYRGAYI